ncbi:unnamed protein product, partial [Owenia fusiformis]
MDNEMKLAIVGSSLVGNVFKANPKWNFKSKTKLTWHFKPGGHIDDLDYSTVNFKTLRPNIVFLQTAGNDCSDAGKNYSESINFHISTITENYLKAMSTIQKKLSEKNVILVGKIPNRSKHWKHLKHKNDVERTNIIINGVNKELHQQQNFHDFIFWRSRGLEDVVTSGLLKSDGTHLN